MNKLIILSIVLFIVYCTSPYMTRHTEQYYVNGKLSDKLMV